MTTLDRVFRDEWGRVLATLIGLLGEFDLAEEAAQEAQRGVAAAAEQDRPRFEAAVRRYQARQPMRM